MTDLITRIEQADGPRRELFEEAWAALGNQAFSWDDWHHPDTPAFHKWSRYQRMLDVEAWTSAAEMLVPEGWNWMAGERNQGKCRAYVENDQPAFVGIGATRNPNRKWFEVVAAHPSLALLAAILRAERNEP